MMHRSRSRSAPFLVQLGLAALVLSGCAAHPVPVPPAQDAVPPAGSAAERAATADPADPVAARLAVYLRLLTPGGGTAGEILGFLAANPGWPNRALLLQRLDQAIAAGLEAPDAATCAAAPLAGAAALLRCAGAGVDGIVPAGALSSLSPGLIAAIRRAWINGIDQPDKADAVLRQLGGVLTAQDQWRRFDREEWSNDPAAARTLVLLAPGDRALAAARLAQRRGAPDADSALDALAEPAASDPTLLLEHARFLRRADRTSEALASWRGRLGAVETGLPRSRLAAAWNERDALARTLLQNGNGADALQVAQDAAQADPAARLDSDFLCGWILLRRSGNPAEAERRFAPLAASDSVITRSRGAYWTGRARLARGDADGAAQAFAAAAAWPTTFYGQLALARLFPAGTGTAIPVEPAELPGRIAAVPEPHWSQAEAIRFAGLDLARAAELLVAWNDPRHARAFLLRLDQDATSDADHALAASLADRLGLPDVAVAIARSTGRHGLVLARSGWPRSFRPPAGPALPDGLALSVMRQESSFDPLVVSPAGARGLMQLTGGTARDVARRIGRSELPAGGNALLDPDTSMALGTAYLAILLARFNGVVPYAVAAYNAGPHRVDQWLAANNDPALATGTDTERRNAMVDWIETIPFAETRNYVERVIESMATYRQPAAAERT